MDITKQLLTNDSQAVLDCLDHLVIITTRRGKISFLNKAAEHILGYPRKKLIGHAITTILSLDENKRISQYHGKECHFISQTNESIPVILLVREVDQHYLISCNELREKKVLLDELDMQDTQSNEIIALQNTHFKALHQLFTEPCQDLSDTLRHFLTTGNQLFNMETGIVSHVKENFYNVIGVVSNIPELEVSMQMPLENTYCLRTVQQQKTMTFNNIGAIPSMRTHPVYQSLGLESYIGTPILVKQQLYGTLSFASKYVRSKPFTWREHELIEILAAALGNYLSQNQLKEQLSHMASHDELTLLPNRFLLIDRVEQLVNQHTREDTRFALMLVQIDNFKTINDSYGSHIGNHLLIETSHILKQQLRLTDTVSRFGADEFILLLNNASDPAEITYIAQRILKQTQQSLAIEDHKIYLKLRIGIALFPVHGQTANQMITAASKAMEQAKLKTHAHYVFASKT